MSISASDDHQIQRVLSTLLNGQVLIFLSNSINIFESLIYQSRLKLNTEKAIQSLLLN